MTITFYYPTNLTYWLNATYHDSMSIVAFLFLLFASKNLPEEINRKNILKIAAIIKITIVVVLRFTPHMGIFAFTSTEFIYYQVYLLFRYLLFSVGSLIALGTLFVAFGKQNRKYYGNYLLIAGILMEITYILNVIVNFIDVTVIMEDRYLNGIQSPDGKPFWYLKIAFYDIAMTIYVLAISLFIVHSRKHEDKFLFLCFLILIIRNIGGWPVSIIIKNVFT